MSHQSTTSRRSDRPTFTLALVAAALLAPVSAQGIDGAALRVGATSDTMESAAGVEIVTLDAGGLSYGITQGDGYTNELPYNPDDDTIVALGETATPDGIRLGQVLLLPRDENLSTTRVHEFFTPIAHPVHLASALEIVEPAPYHTRWSIRNIVNSPVQYDFPAHVGILLNPTDINGFEAYNQVAFPTVDNEVGVVIRVAETGPTLVDFVLIVDCRGHELNADEIAVTPVALVDGDSQIPANLFEAFVFDYTSEFASLRVRGTLAAGDNTILIGRNTVGDGATALIRNPLNLSDFAGFAPGGGGDNSGSGTDCTPTPPNPDPSWTCAVIGNPPVSDPQCAAAVMIGSGCNTETKKLHGPKCGGAGDSASEQVTESGTGSISVEIPLGKKGKITVGGSYSYGKSSTTTHQFTNSNPSALNAPTAPDPGCGTCVSWYQHGLVCTQVWKYQTYDWIYQNDPWDKFPLLVDRRCEWHKKTLKCNDTAGPSASQACNRTDC